ncbi:hypothetical protein [Prauserella endophytica]|uniref:Tape measure protein n=1 Tax=Prauserella endophytica TaxID=1592324 RepID=A0ABY2RSW1_9PSEU|nr:hypothetical protein [Prauserella endophytica]TKG58047.1 hypothetical protein FCN18_38470 [Prauserella endophytica]
MAAGERTVRIRFDGSVAGLTRAVKVAQAQLSGLEKRTESLRRSTAGFTAGVSRSVGALARFAVVLASLASVLNIVGGVGAAIGAMAGAAGLLPAAGFAAAGALAAVKLGADGITAAFERLTPTLDAMRAEVSATFERSLGPAVTDLQAVLPRLTGGIQQVASALGNAASQFTSMLNSGARTEQLQLILDNTAQIVRNLGAWLAPVGAAFVRVGAVGSTALAGLTAGAGAAGERFNQFVQQAANDGRLQAWIQDGIQAFRELGAIIGDVSAIVRAVFSALNDAGLGLGGTLGALTKQVRAFVESAEGQQVLRALAEAVAVVAQNVSTVLGAALAAIAPVLPPLLAAFAQFTTQITALLVPALQFVGPLLQGLALFLQQNMTWLGPLALAVGGVAVAIRGVTTAVNLWRAAVVAYTVAQWALNAALTANPIGLVIGLITALVAAIVVVWNRSAAFREFFIGVWHAIQAAVGAVVNWFRNAWNTAWTFITNRWRGITGFFSGLWSGVRSGVSSVVNFFRNTWNTAVNRVRGFFSGLGDFVGGVWDGITTGIRSAINAVLRVINTAIRGVNAVTGVVGVPAIPTIPYLAKGGTAQAGRTYLVGEQGPELFTPGRTGRVTNARTTAEAMGGTSGGAQVLELHLDLGEGIRQVVQVNLDRRDRQTRRAVLQGVGAAR